jgi:hypothetical protein
MFLRFAVAAVAVAVLPSIAIGQTPADLFDSNRLQEIHIDIHPGDWAQLKQNFLDDTYYACVFHWIFNGQDIASADAGVRSRGQGSRSGVKPSLKIEFDRYESRQNFLGLKNLVLRANTQDASMMHERVSMELFRKMGLHVPRETHARLYVNGDYAGLYTIVEAVDKAFLRFNFGEDSGYLYSYQWADEFFFEDRGPDPATYSPVPFQPEFGSQTPNPAPIAAMVQTINHAPDAQFQAAVSQFVDLKTFLTEIAAENFLADQDGLLGDYGLNNFYLYRFAGTTQHTFIPWDKSNTFFLTDWPIMRNVDTDVLSKRALAVPELLAYYRAELARAADIAGGAGGWLEQEIQREYLQIQQAAYADTLKQCDPGAIGVLRLCSNEEFDAEVANMLAFARRRSFDVQVDLAGGISEQGFTIPFTGGFTATASGAATPLKAGYARVATDAGSPAVSGLAIFSLRNGTTVVSEAGVPASPLIYSGRIYAELNGASTTGIAVANPNAVPATVSFYFTDSSGRDFGRGITTIPANGQIAQFLNSPPFQGGTMANGTFTFSSSVPVAAIALRGLVNERADFLMTTLPVTELRPQTGSLVFPHFADGGGWTTKVILVNPGDEPLSGTIAFVSQGSAVAAGAALTLTTAAGETASAFRYAIAPRASFRLETAGTQADVTAGSIRVVPDDGSTAPSGVSIVAFRNSGITVTEAGVPAVRTSPAFRLYTEWSGDFAHAQARSIQTGIAVTNSTSAPAAVSFELTRLDGAPSGMKATVTIPANGQISLFLNEVAGLVKPASFQGVLRISGPAGIAVAGLRGRFNERGDLLITTLPAVAEDQAASSAEMVFPHIVEGAGYTTQFVLYSNAPAQSASGTLRYVGQDGQPLKLSMH